MKFDPQELLHHMMDEPWTAEPQNVLGIRMTLLSSATASMVLVAAVLCLVLIPMARRYRRVGAGGSAVVLDVIIVFVRDMIARPALHEKAHRFLPFLLTLFVYVLGMNLLGLVPLEGIAKSVGLPPIGKTPTSILTVCAALACLALVKILLSGLGKASRTAHEHGWPYLLAVPLSPLLWLNSLAPKVPGVAGVILKGPLILIEVIGVIAKCFSLMVRLFANVIAGHALLAILVMFFLIVFKTFVEQGAAELFYVGPAVVLGGVVVCLLELLVAALQAYIFTFLTAMFLGLYVEADH
jgi:F-type H+-transporting ATPase subunit a